jgi:hypothetical protein
MTDPVRDYADKAMRDALLKTDNLRDLVSDVVPDLVDGFDFTRARPFPTRFLLPDGRGREADLLFEVPFGVGEAEQLALVCVLIEHQTAADARMALRTLVYVALYWDKQWSEWEKLPTPRAEFRLRPVLPIVFHTGTQRWRSPRTIAELLGEPEAFHPFAPSWAPLFWELPAHTVDDLLSADEAFLQAMAVVRAEDADRAEFEEVYRATLTRLNATVGQNRSRWSDLIYLFIGWITHRRPEKERSELFAVAQDLAGDAQRREEVRSMVETYADVLLAKGKLEGEREGEAKQTRKLILRLASKQIGAADANVAATLNGIVDLDRLERIFERSSLATSWSELLAIE